MARVHSATRTMLSGGSTREPGSGDLIKARWIIPFSTQNMSQLQLLFPSQGLPCDPILVGTATISYGFIFQPGGAPVGKLPAEIILRIVQISSEDLDEDPSETALLASHVCSYWRNLVVGCPSLWTEVFISNMASGILNVEFASMFLARSGKLPLKITIRAAPGFLGGRWLNVTSAVAELIAPHIHRVRKFHLTYPEGSRIDDVMGMLPRSPAPMLKLLCLRGIPSYHRRDGVGTPLILPCLQPPARTREGINVRESAELFPGLRSLSFVGASPRWSTFAPRNLRSLILNNLGPSAPVWPELRAVLQANAPTLGTLVVHNSCRLPSPSCLPCTLPALEFLSLGDRHPVFLGGFIRLIGAPALVHFSLSDTRRYGEAAIPSVDQTTTIAAMLRHIPLHQLHTVHLSHLSFLPSTLPNGTVVTPANCELAPRVLFSRLPQLRHLTLVHPDEHTVRALSHPLSVPAHPAARPTHPMPLLSHLDLECIDERGFAAIMGVLNRRVMQASPVPAVRRLEWVTVWFPEGTERQLDSAGFRSFTRIGAEQVMYEDMFGECPQAESLECMCHQ
ncbi:hypothetical protein BD779DRAFT_427147 [Infundibulicybe gibba]|nr:hypothetical protein BD779DRAFT_427147 [Infundibulicybe gibba]